MNRIFQCLFLNYFLFSTQNQTILHFSPLFVQTGTTGRPKCYLCGGMGRLPGKDGVNLKNSNGRSGNVTIRLAPRLADGLVKRGGVCYNELLFLESLFVQRKQ